MGMQEDGKPCPRNGDEENTKMYEELELAYRLQGKPCLEPLPEDLQEFMKTDKAFIEYMSCVHGDGTMKPEDMEKQFVKRKVESFMPPEPMSLRDGFMMFGHGMTEFRNDGRSQMSFSSRDRYGQHILLRRNGGEGTFQGRNGLQNKYMLQGENDGQSTLQGENGGQYMLQGTNGDQYMLQGENGQYMVQEGNGGLYMAQGRNNGQYMAQGRNNGQYMAQGRNGEQFTLHGENGGQYMVQRRNEGQYMLLEGNGGQSTLQGINGGQYMVQGRNGGQYMLLEGNSRQSTLQGINGGQYMVQGRNGGQYMLLEGNSRQSTLQGINGGQYMVQGRNGGQYMLLEGNSRQSTLQGINGGQYMAHKNGLTSGDDSSLPSREFRGEGRGTFRMRGFGGRRRKRNNNGEIIPESLHPDLAGLKDLSEEDRQAVLQALSDISGGPTELPPYGQRGQLDTSTAAGISRGTDRTGDQGEGEIEGIIQDVKTAAKQCTDDVTLGMNTVIILDTSSSMQGERLNDAKQVVERFITGVEDICMERGIEENVALVLFGGRTRILQHLTNDYDKLRSLIGNISCYGSSDMTEALATALGMMERGGAFRIDKHVVPQRLILITDGHLTLAGSATADDRPQPGTEEKVTSSVVELARKMTENAGMKFVIIPIGSPNESLLHSIIEVTKGELCLAGDSRWLSREYLHHNIAAYIQARGNCSPTDRQTAERLAKEKYKDLTDSDITAVMYLLEEDVQRQN